MDDHQDPDLGILLCIVPVRAGHLELEDMVTRPMVPGASACEQARAHVEEALRAPPGRAVVAFARAGDSTSPTTSLWVAVECRSSIARPVDSHTPVATTPPELSDDEHRLLERASDRVSEGKDAPDQLPPGRPAWSAGADPPRG